MLLNIMGEVYNLRRTKENFDPTSKNPEKFVTAYSNSIITYGR